MLRSCQRDDPDRHDRGEDQSAERGEQVAPAAARELFALPFFYTAATGITSFRRGVRGPTSVLPVLKVGTWNIHEWEMD